MRLYRYLILLVVIFIQALPVCADVVYDAHTQIELVSDRSVIRLGEPFQAAVRMKMDPGWHVYWQNSGDSGLPVSVQWILPEGFHYGEIHWPMPQRFDEEGLTTYGYLQGVSLISDIIPSAGIQQESVTLRANLRWLACEQICVPGRADISLNVSVGSQAQEGPYKTEFEIIRRQWPLPSPWKITASQDSDQIYIEAQVSPVEISQISSVEFYPLSNEVINHSGSQAFQKTAQGFSLSVPKSNLLTKPVNAVAGILIVTKDQRDKEVFVVEVEEVPIKSVGGLALAPVKMVVPRISLAWACLFAFIGGLILNLMPCVLPVLSIKILSLVEHTADHAWALASGGIYTLGVLVSFWLLSGLLIVLKALGLQAGWGFQFQSPGFLISLCLVLFFFALNLWGLFEISLFFPKAAEYINKRHGYLKVFFSGVLAVVLATPCTAPFMGTAVGFAVTQGAAVNMLIFTSIGLGFAFPFLILSFYPEFLKFIPKPGPWMKSFKKFLALLLVATILWLIWILSYVIEDPMKKGQSPVQTVKDESSIAWLGYSPELMQKLALEGRPIFLDFTAKWCLSCQVNERVALNNKKVAEKFRELGVVAVKADWTRFDEQISSALAEFGKDSIPLYVLYYGDAQKTVKVLPEIITPDIVLRALDDVVQSRGKYGN